VIEGLSQTTNATRQIRAGARGEIQSSLQYLRNNLPRLDSLIPFRKGSYTEFVSGGGAQWRRSLPGEAKKLGERMPVREGDTVDVQAAMREAIVKLAAKVRARAGEIDELRALPPDLYSELRPPASFTR
jgi:hypothetical protein